MDSGYLWTFSNLSLNSLCVCCRLRPFKRHNAQSTRECKNCAGIVIAIAIKIHKSELKKQTLYNGCTFIQKKKQTEISKTFLYHNNQQLSVHGGLNVKDKLWSLGISYKTQRISCKYRHMAIGMVILYVGSLQLENFNQMKIMILQSIAYINANPL